jgi:8-oxo-dGTP pyrophosphatase MutT (NUDIX family)
MKPHNPTDEFVKRELERNPRRDVAVVILVDRNKNILLVRTKRLPNQWQPAGGGVKPSDNSVEAAAIREVREEFGLELTPGQLRKIYETSYDFGEGTVYFFIARTLDTSKLSVDTSEVIEWRWLSLETAQGLPMFPATAKCLQSLKDSPGILDDWA